MNAIIRAGCIVGVLAASGSVVATQFNIAGNYSGSINGTPFTAASSGWLNSTNGSLDVNVDFSNMPTNYGIRLPASCWTCFICCNGRIELNNAVNMLTLTGGAYSFNRVLTYADGSQVS